MALLSDNTVEQVRTDVDIEKLISEYSPVTRNHKCKCPIHADKTASLHVYVNTNTWHCFGCNAHGDVIDFYRQMENCDFQDAVVQLAEKNNIAIKYQDTTPEQEAQIKREQQEKKQIWNTLLVAQAYFLEQYAASAVAQQYAEGRWTKAIITESGIGYAPQHGLQEYAEAKGYSVTMLELAGLIAYNQEDTEHQRPYEVFRNRLTIPVYDKTNHIIAFTARIMADNAKTAKYINNPTTKVFNKSQTLFGINSALCQVGKSGRPDRFYFVEGAPDVLRLHCIGIYTAIAPLGTAAGERQFEMLKRQSNYICFLPDHDIPKGSPMEAPGFKAVIEHGRLAFSLGMRVSVKVVPEGEKKDERGVITPCKNDPDSYCTSPELFQGIPEEDFILWYAGLLHAEKSDEDVLVAVADLLATMDDDVRTENYLTKLTAIIKGKTTWKTAIKAARDKRTKHEVTQEDGIKHDLLATFEKYGFYEDNNCYYAAQGARVQWSNFKLTPLFHIRDQFKPARLFYIENEFHQKEFVEFKQEELTSLVRFTQKVEGLGNFVWLAKDDQLKRLKRFLYENTPTATEIRQLGWQRREEVYAFGNGIWDGQWYTPDDLGIVNIPHKGNFYLPSVSSIYKGDCTLFEYEHKFVLDHKSSISLLDYTTLMVQVFGDNAKVGIAFLLAALFRDVVVRVTGSFPLLNVFGPKGTGKSELGHALMAFFIAGNKPENLKNTTPASLSRVLARCSNALVHLDEFKNDIKPAMIEALKGIWDGTGRSITDKDSDKTKMSRVDTAVIVTGQEMATVAPELLSRFLFLQCTRTTFTADERARFKQLEEVRFLGCSHLTLQILKYRSNFQERFKEEFRVASQDIAAELRNKENGENIEDRNLKNWTVPVAAMRSLRDDLSLPFSYNDLLSICVDGMIFQNQQNINSNEVAKFWGFVSVQLQTHQIVEGAHFKLIPRNYMKFKDTRIDFSSPTTVLYLNYKPLIAMYCADKSNKMDAAFASSLESYLRSSPGYIGFKQSQKFLLFDKTGFVTTQKDGAVKREVVTSMAYYFYYNTIQEEFGIDLRTYSEEDSDED